MNNVNVKRLLELRQVKVTGRKSELCSKKRFADKHLIGTISQKTLEQMLRHVGQYILGCPAYNDTGI